MVTYKVTEKLPDGGWSLFLDCSKCGITLQWLDHEEYPKFCTMCGAGMREEEQDENPC